MSRTNQTKHAIAMAAGRLLAESGVDALTMTAVANEAGVARATIHNNVKDRSELLQLAAQLVLAEALEVAGTAANGADTWLATLADWVAGQPVIAGVRTHDPDLLVSAVEWVLAQPDEVAAAAVAGLTAVGAHADLNAVDAILRWLASYALMPGTAADRAAAADILAAALRLDALL